MTYPERARQHEDGGLTSELSGPNVPRVAGDGRDRCPDRREGNASGVPGVYAVVLW